jgi:transcriptional regulator with XRE-family HTH domain
VNKSYSSEIIRRLAYNLKTIREKRKLTQGQLNRRCKFPTGFVHDIEEKTKNPSVANIESLCLALDCTLYDLLRPLRH